MLDDRTEYMYVVMKGTWDTCVERWPRSGSLSYPAWPSFSMAQAYMSRYLAFVLATRQYASDVDVAEENLEFSRLLEQAYPRAAAANDQQEAGMRDEIEKLAAVIRAATSWEEYAARCEQEGLCTPCSWKHRNSQAD